MKYNLITILGPTAVGKTRLGALLAHRFNGEVISADSRQVYIGMDIGTGKDLDDYNVDGKIIPYHLINVLQAGGEFNLFSFNELFYKCFDDISSRNKIPFLVGGTGLYLHSILKSYELNKVEFDKIYYEKLMEENVELLRNKLFELNPNLHNTTDLLIKDRIVKAIMISERKDFLNVDNKIKIDSLVIGVNVERSIVRDRITKRLKLRLDCGMIDEVKDLIDNGITFEKLEFFGLEYKFIAKYLKKELTYDQMFEKLNTAIHQFAKRQMTWFRKMEREGLKIHWIENEDYESAERIIVENYFNE
jgi:tRNA dimethylallyltransferase